MALVIRPVELTDAAALLAYIQDLAAEPDIDILLEPGEIQFTVEQEAEFLAGYLQADNSLFLVALRDGTIVGSLSLDGGRFRALRHVVTLGISVSREHRNQGIGRALLAAAIAWCRESGIVQRVELQVMVGNVRAIHLYQRFGFEFEGRRRDAVRRLGQSRDTHLMALLLPGPA